jgi:hypothetical protein
MRHPLTVVVALAASAAACDFTNPTLAIRVDMSPTTIVAGGSDTATIRVTVVNLTARPIDQPGPPCDNLFAVENLAGAVVVSNYRVTSPLEDSAPWGIQLTPFGSVDLTRRWTGAYVRDKSGGGFETVALPPGTYRMRGTFGELRSAPQRIALTNP